jgi:hypothetical protein
VNSVAVTPSKEDGDAESDLASALKTSLAGGRLLAVTNPA